MFLHISDNMTIEDVQDRFRECFPSLDIVFYRKPHKREQASEKSDEMRPMEKLADIRSNHYNGVLEIKSWYSVARVEQELKEIFGLNAQIFRQDETGRWIQTTSSDAYTLADQMCISFDALQTKL
jgi:hypothetical protein